MDLFDNDRDYEILSDVLRCVISINQRLGKTASGIFYESLAGMSVISSEEIIPCLLKILVTGYSSSAAMLPTPDVGADILWERKLADHKSVRKFSIEMLILLQTLCKKAATWGRVLDVIESFLKFLVPRKIIHNFDTEILSGVHSSILVQATSQISKVMFESTLDMLLFLRYLVKINGQVSFFFFSSCYLSFILWILIKCSC